MHNSSPDQEEVRISIILASSDYQLLAVEENGNLLGWLHAIQTYRVDSSGFVEIVGISVSESARRKGGDYRLIKGNTDHKRYQCY